jgi:hypothetical protein
LDTQSETRQLSGNSDENSAGVIKLFLQRKQEASLFFIDLHYPSLIFVGTAQLGTPVRTNAIKLFTVVIYNCSLYTRVFALGKLF